MTEPVVPAATVRAALARACRAPSLHNSQPWRWRWDGTRAMLFADRERRLPSADVLNRQGMLGCGVMLHHAAVAFAAAGLPPRIARFPNPADRSHLASLTFSEARTVTEGELSLAAAMDRRYTDRAPMAPVEHWCDIAQVVAAVCDERNITLRVLDESLRPDLDSISWTATALRRRDPRYQTEARWWIGGAAPGSGVPAAALPAREDSGRVAVNREFPAGIADYGSEQRDAAHLLLLATPDDSPEALLACGEALSAVLLEFTDHDVSTCVLTHLTELPATRTRVAELTGAAHPQLLMRAGVATAPRPPRTPRRAIDDIFEVV
ncbi:Acg family FMN-binding oxidoreductase [Nocardia farcinica]|uniref:Acg family FMN-binding oxidoreductase n=1 Tax=Nocardia farcinica TaxID=37329 RepID=UPI001893D896|nr:hypothetical protein [Nocardia farcinica]MBF6235029.1 hypothetical protein [Nocardia farcinica]